MKIKLIAFQDSGLPNIGLSRISSYVKRHFDDVETFFYDVQGHKPRVTDYFAKEKQGAVIINQDFIARMADADLVGVSCVSKYRNLTATTIFLSQLKAVNPSCFTVWGGVHAIINPEACIPYADAVCLGEGEKGFVDIARALHDRDEARLVQTAGFWIRREGRIIQNPARPLLTSAELNEMPFQDFGSSLFYADSESIQPFDGETFLSVSGTTYSTMWAMGCPFRCIYCGNSRFLAIDRDYATTRYPTPEYIVREIREVIEKHDYLLTVELVDDNFFFVKERDIIRFAELYKAQVGLPLCIPGIYPGSIRNEKLLDILIDAGLRKVRMGIQSGSERMLSFLNRKTRKQDIIDTANLLISKYPAITPPFFDVIMDIPGEEEADIQDTLGLLGSLRRPFFLYIYSLRVIPGTELSTYALQHPEGRFVPIDQSYGNLFNNRYAALLYLTSLMKPLKPVTAVIGALSRLPVVGVMLRNGLKLLSFARQFGSELRRGNLRPFMVLFPGVTVFLYRHQWFRRFRKRIAGLPPHLS